jgi:hypothetical protein
MYAAAEATAIMLLMKNSIMDGRATLRSMARRMFVDNQLLQIQQLQTTPHNVSSTRPNI